MFGMYKPDWMKTPEDYSIVRAYDEIYEFDLKEYVSKLNG